MNDLVGASSRSLVRLCKRSFRPVPGSSSEARHNVLCNGMGYV